MPRSGSRDGVQYGPPKHGKGMVVRRLDPRRCEAEGCPTILSTYNASATCWLHTGPSIRHPLYPS